MIVAFLGPRGTFTEQAARKAFGNAEFVAKPTLTDVFMSIEQGDADSGVVPVENSTQGSVRETLDLLLDKELMVRGEIITPIRHNLIINPLTRVDEIRRILSHSQALAQCKKYLHSKFYGIPQEPVSSTARAVELLRDRSDCAAIGTRLAAEIYGMKVVEEGIEDNPNNFTRFYIIAKHDSPRTGRDKTSVIFSVKNIPGALYKAIKPFADRNINLSKIESRPVKTKPWSYIFYLDFEGHKEDAECKEALEELKGISHFVKVIGSYPRAE